MDGQTSRCVGLTETMGFTGRLGLVFPQDDVGDSPLQLARKRRALLGALKTQLRHQRERGQALTLRFRLPARRAQLRLHLRA